MIAGGTLLPYVVRATRWRPVAAGAGCALLFSGGMTVAPVTLDAAGLTITLRFAALLGAVGAAFLLDDPSESTSAVTPSPRRLRVLLRPLVVAPVACGWWAGVLLMLRADAEPRVWAAVPLTGLSLEAAGLLAVAVAVAALGVRRPPHDGGGIMSAVAVVAFAAVGQFLPGRVAMFPAVDSAYWDQIHQVWVWVPPAALGLLVWAARDLLPVRSRV